MKRILVCLFLGLFALTLPTRAQDHNPALRSLSQLSRGGQLSQLIASADSLLADTHLTDADRGATFAYLAFGYKQSGDLHRATAAYEQALAVINRDGLHSAEYADILAALSTVYAELGQIDAAKHLLLRSVRLFEKQNDHAGAALVWINLSTMAADEHSSHDAHRYIARALAESQLTTDITPDQLAALAATQARIAQFDGDSRTAIASYQRSLALWKQSHTDQQPETAWLYVLLGGAYLDSGDLADARDSTLHGMRLLQAASGAQSPRYFSAQLAYSRILDASGSHAEASTLRTIAQSALTATTHASQNSISVSALR